MSTNDMRIERWSSAADTETASTARLSPVLSASVHVSGAWTIVTIAGEMDLQVTPLFRELVGADARHLVFDLRRVTFLDVCGVAFLARRQRDALQAGGCVRLVAPSRKVRQVLMLTGLNREFTTYPSVGKATMAPLPGP